MSVATPPRTESAPMAARTAHSVPRPERKRRHRTRIGRIVRMTRFELAMIFKQKVALMSVLLAPATAIGIASFSKPTTPGAWHSLTASMTILVLIMAVYTTTTSAVVSRRESQVFKRFRTSELLPRQMMISLAMPYVLVGVAQVAILTTAYHLMGAPMPQQPLLFGAVVLVTTVMSVVAGFATASLTTNSERVQFGVMPVMMLGLVTSIMVLNPGMSDELRTGVLLAPYAAASNLCARFLGVDGQVFAQPGFVSDLAEKVSVSANTFMTGYDIAVTALWFVIFTAIARKAWRWEPRG